MRKKLLVVLAFFLTTISVYSQCTDCITNPTTGTFVANTKYCFTEDKTFSDVTFADNVKICIAEGKKLTIQNNINYTGSNPNVTFDISGSLVFGQSPQIRANLTITIQQNGSLKAGTSGTNNFSFSGVGRNVLTNYGKVDVGVLGFDSGATGNVVDNYGVFDVTSNMNVSSATTFRNYGSIYIGDRYNNNSNGIYINCGTITAVGGYNLEGGKVINTGTFNVTNGNIAMSSGSVENYGNMLVSKTITGSSNAVLYNEGLLRVNEIQLDGRLKGPTSLSKKGYIYIVSKINPNQLKVGPNLDFSRYTSLNPDVKSTTQGAGNIFNSTPTYVSASGATGSDYTVANVSFDCTTCPAIVTSIGVCANVDGTFPPVANNSTYTIDAGANSTSSVLSNDLAAYNGVGATTSNVTITQLSTTNSGVNINTATGDVVVSPGTPSGIYTIVYKICSTTNSSNCSNEASVTVTVVGSASASVCTKPPVGGTPDGYSKVGVTTKSQKVNGWPENVPNGHIVLESKNKGFIITRTVASAITHPVEGMLIYDTTDKCIKLYSVDSTGAGKWACIKKACND